MLSLKERLLLIQFILDRKVRVIFPTFCHYVISKGMSKKKALLKTVGPILNEQDF